MITDSSIELNPEFTLDSFIAGTSSGFALASAREFVRRVSGMGVADSYNPLFLFGPSGVGKTHLLHAIGSEARRMYPDLRVRYFTAESLSECVAEALRSHGLEDLRRELRHETGLLLLDDIEGLADRESTQEEVFHALNVLRNAGHPIVVTGSRHFRDINLPDRLTSRLGWGLAADIQPFGAVERAEFLNRLVRESGIEFSPNVLQLFVRQLPSNGHLLKGMCSRILERARFDGLREVTREFVIEHFFRDLETDSERIVSPDHILAEVARVFSVTTKDLKGSSRLRRFVEPRQIAMWLIRRTTCLSLPRIGKLFGGRDHTTVIHAVRKIDADLTCDPTTRARVSMVVEALELPIDLDRLSA